jgi:hypothetical protein
MSELRNGHSLDNIQVTTVPGSLAMNDDQKKQALAAWYKLLKEPEIHMDVEEQYDELLKAADEMERTGLISGVEWRKLVKEASTAFATATEGVDGGTSSAAHGHLR